MEMREHKKEPTVQLENNFTFLDCIVGYIFIGVLNVWSVFSRQ